MAHAAELDATNIVRAVIVVPDDLGGDENDAAIKEYINGIGITGHWIRTSYNANIRGRYAGIGDSYDPIIDEFIPPAPAQNNPEPETTEE
jgi:hypothetical protein